ncbi:MAG: ATP-dependent DNA helicase RecG [SAR86 cluster bacterium]|jgi:ATP-dependent DNA helicase RecG|nr:ATP-dependent DNA helicase RecG [SAR86 cluster bacterium]RCL43528.1 MAG: ATP-dependent DNA helicase RecG [SAR86 cluster bacterium]|tara:strand:- start:12420 stop:14480 length:2061 start_codon:yes stop_codon:yes gene_type:complete
MSEGNKLNATSLPISSLKGVGEKLSNSLIKLGIRNLEDLLFHFPIDYLDRTKLEQIADLTPENDFVIRGEIEKVSQTFVPRKMLLVKVKDKSGQIFLRFFYYFPSLRNIFKEGANIQVAGKSRLGRYGLETIHPDYEILNNEDFIPKILPKYRLTKGITQQKIRKIISQTCQLLRDKKIEIDDYINHPNFQSLNDAVVGIHQPDHKNPINDYLIGGESKARLRIGLEEIIANKISYLSIKKQNQNRPAEKFENNTLATNIEENLPFSLTPDQKKSYQEIAEDMASGSPMLRLLQGDVGSGKTIVAALIAAHAVEDQKQVVILAPTTILANQHYESFCEWYGDNKDIVLLTSKLPVREKREIYQKISDGIVKIIIGTHAVFQDELIYQNLSLVIYDEQHRFGVNQRLKLKEKANDYPHQLLLSATPIPRTMAMGVLSGLDISTIKSLPPNRIPVTTSTLVNSKRDALIKRIQNAIANDSQVYWVCPLIEESENDLTGIEELEKILKKEFSKNDYEIIHGKMKDDEKKAIIKNFKDRKTKILLATTVIEVGIDVPDANIMVIENAERFGLSQLHQLRGRVGRGTKESFCILMHSETLSEISKERLRIITETSDGFSIAESDLKLRGPGDILGLSQTGLPSFTFYDLLSNKELQNEADKYAKEIIKLPVESQRKIIERWFPAHLELSDV